MTSIEILKKLISFDTVSSNSNLELISFCKQIMYGMSKALCDFAIKNILAYANQFTLSSQSPMCTQWMMKHFHACSGLTSMKLLFSIVYCK